MPRRNFFASVYVGLFFAVLAARPALADNGGQPAGPLSPEQVPAPLKPWIGWSLRGFEEFLCPREHATDMTEEDAAGPFCLWPSRLNLELDAHGGKFSQSVRLYRDAMVPLPGDETAWPQEVRVDGENAPVVESPDGAPLLQLRAGEHALAGAFHWSELPESIHVPRTLGLVSLSLRGKPVPFPSRDADGLLWLQREQEDEAGESRLDVKVWRKVTDEVPLELDTRVQLEVSGKNREVLLGRALLDGFVPVSLDSQLPSRLEADGRLRVQVRPGTFRIELVSRHRGDVTALELPKDAGGPWASEELWAFAARPNLRVAEIVGVATVDPAQTTLPNEWRSLPAFRVRPGETMHFNVERRGDADPAPDQLSLSRIFWLDFDGKGATARDQLTGTLTRSDRLEMPAPSELGRVRAQGRDQLITRLAENSAPGVELREGQLAIEAESRTALSDHTLPAVGWSHGVRSLTGQLNLPPGWRLLHASGVDDVSPTWLQSWSLLDLFLLLLAALAAGKLFGWPIGVAMFAALGLALPEGAPKWLWLLPLAAEALLRVVPAGRVQAALRLIRGGALLLLLLLLVPFAVRHLRTSIYPALDRDLNFEESNGYAWSEAPMLGARAQMQAVPEPDRAIANDEEAAPLSVDGAGVAGGRLAPAERPSSLQISKRGAKRIAVGDISIVAKSGMGSSGIASYQQKLDLSQIDPNAVAQTGPGLPEWSWRSIQLRWSGPVEAGAKVRLWLLSPGANVLLAFLRVFLLAVLWLKLLAPKPGGLRTIFARFAKPAAVASAIIFILYTPAARATEVSPSDLPSDEMIEELRSRLTAPPICGDNCLSSPHLIVEANGSMLRLRMQIDAAALVAAALPGALGQWSPDSVSVDGASGSMSGKSSIAMSRSEDGTLWIALSPGAHQLVLEGALPLRDEVQLALPLKPKHVEAHLTGWTLAGVHDDGTVDEALQLVRVQRGSAASQRLEPGQLPPFLEVQRALLLGMTWQLSTRVMRKSPEGAPITVEVPLLPGESITSADVRAQNGKAQLAFGPHTSELSWTSSLAQVPTIQLTAADDAAFAEVWRLEIAPTWHVEVKGIPPVHQEIAPQRVPEYRPWPGESLVLNISRPSPVPGTTLTVQSSTLEVTPGARTSDAQLSLRLSTSRGGPTAFNLPESAELQQLTLDNAVLPLRQDGQKVSLALSPGEHRALLDWREPRGVSILYKTPRPNLGTESVNASLNLHLQNRWVLFAGGPRLGPAVLIWSFILVMLLCSFGLSRMGTTPLHTRQWMLLALGLSQVDVIAAAVVAGWLLILGWRRTASPRIPGSRRFDLLQILLVIWTIVAACIFIGSIQRGLLGEPEMQVSGNGSSASLLRWFVDRTGAELPGGWVISFPIFVYRLAMLAWALWLAAAMVRWLPWAWESFSAGGLWRAISRKPKAKKESAAPASTTTAVASGESTKA